MRLIFSRHAWEDYLYWQKVDKRILKRVNHLIRETWRQPFEGIGKPEPLKHGLAGYWSRRITEEDRMVYKVTDDALLIAQLKHSYRGLVPPQPTEASPFAPEAAFSAR